MRGALFYGFNTFLCIFDLVINGNNDRDDKAGFFVLSGVTPC